MKIFIVCSKHFYGRVLPVKKELESLGHAVTLPNSFDEPLKEEDMKHAGAEEHRIWKSEMLRLQKEKVAANDALLALNFEKNGTPNYIGGATFLEIYQAFDQGKKYFFIIPCRRIS